MNIRNNRSLIALSLGLTLLLGVGLALAHPLGNFTINHFAKLSPGAGEIQIRYVVDLAEIPAFQELKAADKNGDGVPSTEELNARLGTVTPDYLAGLLLSKDGKAIELNLRNKQISLHPGMAELPTMRLTFELIGKLDGWKPGEVFRFENANGVGKPGWYELAIEGQPGVVVYDSSIFGNSLTDELKAYPEDQLTKPLNERGGSWSLAQGGVPANGRELQLRDGRTAPVVRDRFAELIAVPRLTFGAALLGLLIAFGLGGIHALSPGHGKTVVGAYLVGSRGTWKHAAFLGLTVTLTHTAGVFALGLITLFASEYILPEKLFPILTLASGMIVLAIGLTLFVRRLRSTLAPAAAVAGHPHDHHESAHDERSLVHDHGPDHGHTHEHDHGHSHEQDHSHTHLAGAHMHGDGGGHVHSHLPPGAAGERVTWRSLVALGVSGGLLPCPSALVVLLAAISLGRIGYGLVLIVAFSFGLASVLTAIGLIFVYARQRLNFSSGSSIVRILPVLSALVIAVMGGLICYEALAQGTVQAGSLGLSNAASQTTSAGALSIVSILGAGLVFGLKHAIEADHLAAVSTIVSERRSLIRSSVMGGLWGLGHTISLLAAGIVVILLKVEIPERVAQALEFCVAIMLIGLGINVLIKLRQGGKVHLHSHSHGGHEHNHLHIHSEQSDTDARSHHGMQLSIRPVLIGMVHGLAGSAALMLIVLASIESRAVAFAYIAVFGIGSIGGMMLMSSIISLPGALAAKRFSWVQTAIRTAAGCFSLLFGLFMAWEIGYVDGLFR